MHKSSAWPLALVYVALVLYASLYPFNEWRDQGIGPFAYLTEPWPAYWGGFDVVINVLGYAPLGFLIALAGLRSNFGRAALVVAIVACMLLSGCMEALQTYLPSRVSSNLDFALNTVGGAVGAFVAGVFKRIGLLEYWSRLRARWFVPESRGALVLLVLWPIALLYPPPIPFGLGRVLDQLNTALNDVVAGTPFANWIALPAANYPPLAPPGIALCVGFGLLIPCLIAYTVQSLWSRRLLFLAMIPLGGVAVDLFSTALNYGVTHSWRWLNKPVIAGFAFAAVLATLLLPVSRRTCAAVGLLALGIYLTILNLPSASAFAAQTIQTWGQGHIAHFYGWAHWLGWLWPYAALVYLLLRVSRREP